MPNLTAPEIAEGTWRDYLTSVDKIEEMAKLDLLSNLPVEVQKVLEAKIDSGRAANSKTE
jgi:endonuclease G